MRGKWIAVLVCSASLGVATAHGQFTQPGYPGGYGGLGAYGGYGSGGYGYGFDSNAFGPYTNQGPYAPNPFNRQNQPLSPYLNLLRGSNPAVNYFYNVRPGTQPPAFSMGGGMNGGRGGQMRMPYFPQQFDADPLGDADQPGRLLPPAGHPVVFNNTMGYFPGQGGMGRSGGMRPGVLGVGNQGQGQNQSQGRPAPKR